MLKSLVAFLAVTFCLSAHAYDDSFAKIPEIQGARISPTGEYLAVVKEEDERRVVAVFEFPKMELINVIAFPGKNEVGNFWWVNDDRILVRVDVDWGNREQDISYGELYAVNADGTRGKYLFGLRGDQLGETKSRIQRVTVEYGSASFEHARWQDPDTVLVSIREWSRGFKNVTYSAFLDVYTGRITNKILAPTSNAFIISDHNGDVRFSQYLDDDQTSIIHFRNPETNKWEEFSRAAFGESQIDPISMHRDGRIYVTKSENDGPEGVYLMDPKTQEFEEVYQHDLVDADGLMFDWEGNVYGAASTPGYMEYHFTDEEHPSAQLRMGLMNAFPDTFPRVGSTTHDYKLSVVELQQDVRSGEFYLYNSETGQLQLLFDAIPWMNDQVLSPMEPVEITARDGVELHGYLTVPRNAKKKDLPLIIVPHGGPHGPRDYWGYQWFEGFIPLNGYAMLQVNYRGSGGYGMKFERMGYKEWGKKMQNDLTDATQWAIEQGIADPERICIWGWSYGGYAALMGVVREPDLYKCAVGGAGVYDNKIQFDSDFGEGTRWGRKYLARVIGDMDALNEASSVYYVDQIKTPVLLIHGDDDQRVPIEHAYTLQNAYKKAGKNPPRLIKLKNEAHTPRNEDNWRLLQRESIKFFEKHIGKGVLPKPDKNVAQR